MRNCHRVAAVCLLSLGTLMNAARAAVHAEVVAAWPSTGTAAYPANRAPLQPGALIKLPVASFKPTGWLHVALERQRDGLTGHLGEISKWLTREDNAWLNKSGHGQYGWEEVPYWLRGYARIAYVLNDPKMLAQSKVWIDGTLASQRPDGDFGPIIERDKKRDLWAQMLMLQVLQAYYEFSNDAQVLPFMTNYFKWQLTIPDNKFLQDYWENSRGGDNLASVYWLYNRTGDDFLLDLAAKIDRNTADWRQKDDLPNWHVVNIAECFREPATFSLQSKRKADLDASYNSFRLAREKYGQVPGGMFGADENARPGHTDPHQASETCSFVEQLWSNLLMSEITGDVAWAENSEDVAFNSLPAAFTPDYRALRYLTAPNQVVSDAKNHAPGIANDGPFMLMNPFSSRCCQHNHTSGWVNYAETAWMATPDGGLAAVLYAPGELNAKVTGGDVTLVTDTKYPFEDEIRIAVKAAPAGAFPLLLRVPTWAEDASVTINGKPADVTPKAGGYVRLSNAWKTGDVIALKLPMKVRVRTWTQNKNSVSIDRGPLTYSLKIDENYHEVPSEKTAMGDSGWQPTADPKKWPSHEILPKSPWNYALAIDPSGDVSKAFEVVSKPWPKDDYPFTNDSAPVQLKTKAKLLPDWKLDEHGLCGELPMSPVKTDQPATDVTLVPMGGARLRISAFPVAAK
jgi:hypothetical protein